MSIEESGLLLAESIAVPKRRLFEAGQMKLLVLHLIAQQPKYGYEIIKEVGEVVGGGYCPSTGTIYPTLNYLEQHAYVKSQMTDAERKQYQICLAGLDYLEAQQEQLKKMLCRFDTRRQIHNNQQYLEIKRAMENLKAALRLKIQHSELNVEQVIQIAAHIDQAAVNITRL